MGTSAGALRYRCYNCSNGGAPCSSKERYDNCLITDLHSAILRQDAAKLQDLLNFAPDLREREVVFPDEPTPMSALALALNRRDALVVRALLDAGVSPNLPISGDQRNIYAHRSQLAAMNGGDPDLQHMVPSTHFEALCSTQHKDMFLLLLDKNANPNNGIIQVCHCGDLEMLEAILAHGGEPNSWLRHSTPLVSAVKSRLQPYEKVLALLRGAADPNFGSATVAKGPQPPLTIATRKHDYRLVRLLLEAGADANHMAGDEGLPSVLFWATYWGELELIKLFVTFSKHRLDLSARKHTNETVFDVAEALRNYSNMKKPKHIAKLPLPNRPAVVYDRISRLLEEYRQEHPEPLPEAARVGGRTALTGSTTATRGEAGASQTFDNLPNLP